MLHPGLLLGGWLSSHPLCCLAGEVRAGRGLAQPSMAAPTLTPHPQCSSARGWEQVPFSLAGLGAPCPQPAAELCPHFALLFSDVPFRFLVTGSELPRGPPRWRQKPSLLLERCSIAPKPAHPHRNTPWQARRPSTQAECSALPLQ